MTKAVEIGDTDSKKIFFQNTREMLLVLLYEKKEI